MVSIYSDFYGEWSELEVKLFRKILAPESNVVEIGANLGLHSVPLGLFSKINDPFATNSKEANDKNIQHTVRYTYTELAPDQPRWNRQDLHRRAMVGRADAATSSLGASLPWQPPFLVALQGSFLKNEPRAKVANVDSGLLSKINDPFATNSKEANCDEEALEVAKNRLSQSDDPRTANNSGTQ
jgi:hypothetical protein